ncbi:MAG: ArnT family glycosyltransferase [Thiobacillus sp.]
MARPLSSALLILCLAWLLPGLIGHAPWKGADATFFVRYWLMWQQGDWLLPGAGNDVFPPLYLWVASLTAAITSPFLAPHDGARLASGVFMAIALFFTARAADALYGNDHRWPAALALLGSVGLLLRGHEMNAYTAQLAGVAIVLDGLARLPQQHRHGWTLAAGLSVILLATGLIEAVALLLLAAALPLFLPIYRQRPALHGLVKGLLAALLVGVVWVGVLWFWEQPLVAALQLQRWPGWAVSGNTKPEYVLGVMPWYLWPALPLAAWALYCRRRDWRAPASLLPLLALVVLFAVFSSSINPEEDKLLALAAPTAILAAAGVMQLRRGAAYAFLWFSVMLFGFLGLVFWVYWSAHDLGLPARLAQRLARLGVEDIGRLRVLPFLMGLSITAVWVIFLARLERSPFRPLLVWTAGMAFIWVLLLTLFLDVFDARLSYARVGGALKAQINKTACINARGMGPQARTLLAYHSERDIRAMPVKECNWLLVQRKREQPPPDLAAHWVLDREIVRPGDRDYYFQLYARQR